MKASKIPYFLVLVILSGYFMNLYGQTIDELKEKLSHIEGEEKLSVLSKLTKDYRKISLDSSIFFGKKAIQKAEELKNDSLLADAYLNINASYLDKGEIDKGLIFAEKALGLGHKINCIAITSYAYLQLGSIWADKGKIEQSIDYSLKSLEGYKQLDNTKNGLEIINANLSNSYANKGDYSKAVFYALEVEKLGMKAERPASVGLSALLLTKIYASMDDVEKQKKALQKAKKIFTRDSFPQKHASVLSYLSEIHFKEGRLDSVIYYYKKVLDVHEEMGNTTGIAEVQGNLGAIYQEMGDWENSYYHLQKSIGLKKNLNLPFSLTYDYFNLGAGFQLQNIADSTIFYLLKSLEMAKKYKVTVIQENALDHLYQFYESKGQFGKALDYHKQFITFEADKKGLEIQREIAALETQYKTEKKEHEIERLEFEAIAQTSKTNTFRIGLIAAISLFGAIVFGLLYRRKNERKIFVLKQQMYEQEKKEMDNELSYKTKQLTAHSLHMVQKNKVLQELKSGILAIAKNVESSDKKALRALIRRIDFNIQSDEDWDTFRLYFEQTNQDFYHNLNQINKDLTSNELKLCSLIKLNMNIKETASVLNLAPTSVKTARHRLRKKLNLEQGQDLTSFIRQVA